MLWTDIVGTALTVVATSLALASIREINSLKGHQRTQEDLLTRLSTRLDAQQKAIDNSLTRSPLPTPANASSNIFYAGTGSRVVLDRPILGPPLQGDLDGYDEVYPAALTYGSVVVRGSGRVVLDGDASDLILKIDNAYFSLRELLGFGNALDFAARPPPSLPTPLPRVRELCTSTDLLGTIEGNCDYRRNWGVDACFAPGLDPQGPNPTEPICVCGGGWDPLSRTVTVRHLVKKSLTFTYNDTKNYFFKKSTVCCAPFVSANEGTCNDINGNFAWLDTRLRCDTTRDLMCDAQDRSDYLGLYATCSVSPMAVNVSECAKRARNQVNTDSWHATRDYKFDDGRLYALQLTENVERACTGLRLSIVHTHDFIHGFPAAFTCGSGAPLFFEQAPTSNDDSFRRGSVYRMLTHQPSHAGWFCLSAGLNETTKTNVVGDAVSFIQDQLVWLPFPAFASACGSFYLGRREVFGFGQSTASPLGIYTDKQNNFVRGHANVDFTLLPFQERT
jgi:hypothetical protein